MSAISGHRTSFHCGWRRTPVGQEIFDQIFQPLRLRDGAIEQSADRLLDAFSGELHETFDRPQRVADLMRQHSRHLPDVRQVFQFQLPHLEAGGAPHRPE